MPLTPSGLVFNIQRFSLHDGPGLRSTVFLKGCPLHCQWCHNPESQSPRQEFVRLRHRCIRCGECSDDELASPVVSRRGLADVERCPSGALQAVGQTMTAPELVAAVVRDRIFFDESHGGVTFSGGEPLQQAAFVIDCLRRLRDEGVDTVLDTCGVARWADLSEAATLVSLVLYDLKLIDAGRHRAATGVSNQLVLENLSALARVHSNIRIRVPVIPGVNDDAENLEATAAYLQALPGIRQVDLLPYHATGEAKFARVGMDYTLRGTTPPTGERLETLAAHFRTRGLTVDIGGHG